MLKSSCPALIWMVARRVNPQESPKATMSM